jgi:hypothetical protein
VLIGDSDHSPCSSKTKLVRIEFSDLHVSNEDSVKPWCDQLESQLFEAEYFADEDSVFVPDDVAAIVQPSSPVPANGAPLSVLILAGTPYSRMAASQIARTWLRSILTKSHQLFFAVGAVAPTPQLRTAWIDEEEETITVVNLEWPCSRLGTANRCICKGHGGTPLGYRPYPTLERIVPCFVPTSSAAVAGLSRTISN